MGEGRTHKWEGLSKGTACAKTWRWKKAWTIWGGCKWFINGGSRSCCMMREKCTQAWYPSEAGFYPEGQEDPQTNLLLLERSLWAPSRCHALCQAHGNDKNMNQNQICPCPDHDQESHWVNIGEALGFDYRVGRWPCSVSQPGIHCWHHGTPLSQIEKETERGQVRRNDIAFTGTVLKAYVPLLQLTCK